MPVSGGASAFFPPTMPSFWNAAAFVQHQQQQAAQFQAQFSTGACLSSPTLPMYSNGGSYMPPFQNNQALQMHAAAAAVAAASRNGLSQMPGYGGQHAISPTGVLPSPTFASHCPSPSPPAARQDGGVGVGVLVWLSSQAGLIKKVEEGKNTASEIKISFQLKDFCDQAVTDLTCVLRPGFFLRYQATSQDNQGQSWVANFVSPVHHSPRDGPSLDIPLDMQANLDSPPGVETGPPQLPRDPYDLPLEDRAVPMLLGIFERNGVTQCQLGSFHCQISNCGDDDLYRYIGTSSLKRRQYLERRTHLFHISSSDMVSLQPAAMYTTVLTLVQHLLNRGGACLMQDLFDHFNSCPDIPLEARDMIGEGKTKFVGFLDAHPWLFAVFPSRVFVAARRQLPVFDYAAFINQHFDDQDLSVKGGCGSPKSSGPGTPSFPPQVMEQPPPKVTNYNSNWSTLNEPGVTNGHTITTTDLRFKREVPNTAQPPPNMWPLKNDVLPPLGRQIWNSGAIGEEVQRVKVIRRSCEMQTQTDEPSQWLTTRACVSNWASPPKGPVMVDACVQASGPCMVTTGCGPGEQFSESDCSPSKATLSSLSGDTSSLSAPDSCKDSLALGNISKNINVGGRASLGTDFRSTWSGNSLGEGGFDPFYSPLSLMHNLKLDK